MMQKKIYYKKVRDLSSVFSAAFEFIKLNFKTFFGSLFLVAGPFLLIGSTISTYTLRSFSGLAQRGTSGITGFPTLYGNLIGGYIVTVLLMLVGVTIFNVIFNNNILHNEKLEQDEKLSIKLVISDFFSHYWRVTGNMLLFFIVFMLIFAFLILVFVGFFSIFESSTANVVAVILAILLFISLLFIFFPIISYATTAALFVCQRDRISIFAAFRKVFYYMKQNFWNTWIVSFLALLTYSTLAFIAQLPVFIVSAASVYFRIKSTMPNGGVEEPDQLLPIVVTAVCTLLSFGVLSLYYLMSIYQYGNLEEKSEGLSVLKKINNII